MGGGAETRPLATLGASVAAGLLAAGVAAGVLLLAHDERGPEPVGLPGAPIAIRTSLPATTNFGDRVVARVDVALDDEAVDVHRVQFDVDLVPLTALAQPRVSRVSTEGRTIVSYRAEAACLEDACLGQTATRAVRLHPVRVRVPRQGGRIAVASKSWPVLEVRSRVTSGDLARGRPPFRADVTPPPVGYRVAPSTLAFVLDALAGLLAAAGVLAAARRVLRARTRSLKADQRSDVERALAFAREAMERPAPDRRRALDLLARLLSPGHERLAGTARRLAWSPAPPSGEAVAKLVDDVAAEVRSA